MKGVIIRVLPNKGYGFIRDEAGRSRFMHAKEVIPAGTFDLMRDGMTVEFEPSNTGEKSDGLRALQVRLVEG